MKNYAEQVRAFIPAESYKVLVLMALVVQTAVKTYVVTSK